MINVFSAIYQIRNLLDNCIYIGSAFNVKQRFSAHIGNLRNKKHNNTILQNSFNKYGEENFIFEILEYVEDKTKLIEREQFYIDSLKPQYNICKIAGNWAGNSHSEKTKNVIRESIKNLKKIKCDYCDVYMNIGNLNRYHNDHCYENPSVNKEIEDNLRKCTKGIKYKKQEKLQCVFCKSIVALNVLKREHNDNCKLNPNIKEEVVLRRKHLSENLKISLLGANKGKKRTDEFKERMREDKISGYASGRLTPTFLGRKHTEESNLKNSTTQRNTPKIPCIRCGKMCNMGNLRRWHNDNCKK